MKSTRLLPSPLLAAVCAAGLVTSGFSAPPLLQPESGQQFYFSPDESATLRFRLAEPAGEAVDFIIRDRSLAELQRGRAQLAQGGLAVPLKLPQGYFEIEFPGLQQTFGLLVAPPYTGPRDPYFGMDGALTWQTKDEVRRDRAAILKRLGVSSARDRLLWGALNPAAGQWSWPERDLKMREAYAREGIPVLECFHDTPDWLKAQNTSSRYPDDLLAAFQQWKLFLQETKEAQFGLEIWNEPNIGFGGNLPADQYISLVKAIVAAGRSADFRPPMVGGAFTSGATQGFLQASFDSGLADIVDGVSFHFYGDPAQLVQFSRLYRDFFRQHGATGMPLWLTETGKPWPVDTPARPLPANANEGAFGIALNAIEGKASGIAHYYPFVFSNRSEGTRRYGVIDPAQSPLSSLAAYAQVIRTLSGKQYQGDLRNLPDGLLRGRVFFGGNETLLILASDPKSATHTFLPPAPVIRAEAIDGSPLAKNSDGSYPLAGGVIYLTIDPTAWESHIQRDTEAAELSAQSREPLPPRTVPTVAMKVHVDPAVMDQHSNLAYFISQGVVSKFPLTVVLYNFSAEAQVVNLHLDLPEKARVVSEAAQKTMEIPPLSSTRAEFVIDGSGALQQSQLSPFLLKLTDADGKTLDRLSLAFGLVPEKPRLNLPRTGSLKPDVTIDKARWRQIAGFTPSRHVLLGIDETRKEFDRDDLQVIGRFAWSDAGFVFFYEVTDDTHVTVDGWEGWTGDSLQMAFTSKKSQERYKEPADFEMLLAAQKDGRGGIFFRKDGKAVKTPLSPDTFVKVERDEAEHKTYYLGQISWADLSTLTVGPDAHFAFTFLVNDNDGDGRKGWIEMTSGIGGHKGTSGHAEATMMEQ